MLPANTAPEARSALLQVHEDGRLRIDLAAFGIDAENDALSGRITLQPSHGSVVIGRDVPGHHALNLGVLDLAGWQLDQLHLIPPPRFVGEMNVQVRARSSETSNGSTASTLREITVVALRGTPVPTPPGRNPSVRYLNAALPITASPPQPLRVSPLRPEYAGTPIRLPVTARKEAQIGDEAWIRSLSAELVDLWWDDKAGSKGRVH